MKLPPERIRVAIEQALAFGYSDKWIREHHHVTDATIARVRLHLDEIAAHDDDPTRETCRNGLHPVTPENTYQSRNGKRTCLPCRQDREKERDRGEKKAA